MKKRHIKIFLLSLVIFFLPVTASVYLFDIAQQYQKNIEGCLRAKADAPPWMSVSCLPPSYALEEAEANFFLALVLSVLISAIITLIVAKRNQFKRVKVK